MKIPKNIIFIPGNVPSSKNGRLFNIDMKRSFMSKACYEYKKNTKDFWKIYRSKFIDFRYNKSCPLKVEFFFLRKTKHIFDFNNATSILTDLMKEYDWIEDDNCNIILPYPRWPGYFYNPENPGVEIQII